MRDVNGSNFHLLADPADWFASPGMRWTGEAFTLAGQQVWRLANPPLDRAAALVERAKHPPVVVDEYGAVARIDAAGTTVESLDAGSWTPLLDIDGGKLAPKVGKFVAMALGGDRFNRP